MPEIGKADEIVVPIITENTPHPGNICVLASTSGDFRRLARGLSLERAEGRQLYVASVLLDSAGRFSLAGPMLGSPFAAMVLETLVAWGGKRFVFIGWCGSISNDLSIGDIFVPDRALIDEGTSRHYGFKEGAFVFPDSGITETVKQALKEEGAEFSEGTVWTTDGVFRETRDKVSLFRSGEYGARAVEMEVSGLCSAAKFRNVDVGFVLVVSDDLSSLEWEPGFKDDRFRRALKTVSGAIKRLCLMK